MLKYRLNKLQMNRQFCNTKHLSNPVQVFWHLISLHHKVSASNCRLKCDRNEVNTKTQPHAFCTTAMMRVSNLLLHESWCNKPMLILIQDKNGYSKNPEYSQNHSVMQAYFNILCVLVFRCLWESSFLNA